MKNHDLAEILELTATLLKSLPNTDIAQTIKTLQKISEKSDIKETYRNKSHHIDIPSSTIEKIRSMNTHEIESFLNDSSLFVSTSSIQKLAEILGIQASKRQSRSALINLIVRNQEAIHMDAIIRSGSKIDDKNEQ
ncbi:hypothetical protein V0R50_13165 [Pseudomonas sp. 148P]|uniref:Uncharacterized protein n=1 Tax=Pseudomonas ulcerans TaxID=3115852 RepID=A0ABU7HRL0_9PSED|nr:MULTISPECIES: hypothetical protein [unclassified Pseudomonas]MEE1923215.1 hypothetical protein [Pseudomonas sp. 147P]MEE1934177.1 hypothetical protein [Pseudomonas sp. 148P]